MTLDIDAFRPEKGGDPAKVKANQQRRFADPDLVDKVVASDEAWRQGKWQGSGAVPKTAGRKKCVRWLAGLAIRRPSIPKG